jgi:hypothetical protein
VLSADDVTAVLRRHKPGDRVPVTFVDRSGSSRSASIVLAADPHVEVVPAETAGGTLTPAQRSFRDGWLNPRP